MTTQSFATSRAKIIFGFRVFPVFIMLLIIARMVPAQNVGINATGATPDASAMLDIVSSSKGLLIPRVALTATNAAGPITSPTTSLLVYNTATAGTTPNNVSPGYYFWNGSAWIAFSSASNTAWTLSGNTGLTSSNFIGTGDDKALIFKSNAASFLEFGRRQTLGLTQSAYTDYTDDNEKVTYVRSALQFEAANASFYKPKMWTDANGNFRVKGSSAGTDYFEYGSTGTSNNGGFEFIIGDDGDEPMVFKSYCYNCVPALSEIMRLQSGRMAVGSNAFDATNPEKLLIDAGTTTSYNLMTGKGSINNYLQINVKNSSSGSAASSDLVATADNGSESTNYVDLGINGSGNSSGAMGGPDDAYLYNIGQNLLIGTGSASKSLVFMTGGTTQSTNERMRIDGNGSVGIGTSSFNATNPEQLVVDAGTTTSVNAIVGKGEINSYLQLNIQNQSTGASASSDVVATADNGSETTNYVDMGINGSNNTSGVMGGADDAYLYNIGQNFLIGTGTSAKSLIFMTGGTSQSTNERMRIDGNGKLGIGTVGNTSSAVNSTLEVAGSVAYNITTTSSNLTLDATHYTVIITGGTPTITLPAASSSNARRIYVIVNQTGGSRTISTYKDFGGNNATTIPTVSSITIQSNGTNWYRIQ